MADDQKRIILARYVVTVPILPDGQFSPVRCDEDAILLVKGSSGGGGLPVSFAPPLTFESILGGSLVNSGIVRASPGTLIDVNLYNASAVVVFFQLYDTIAVPADGAIPSTLVLQVPPMSHFSFSPGDGQGKTFATGITFASSTTLLTKTLTAAPDFIVTISHRNP